jgi:hypothetical protein
MASCRTSTGRRIGAYMRGLVVGTCVRSHRNRLSRSSSDHTRRRIGAEPTARDQGPAGGEEAEVLGSIRAS